MNTQNDSTLLDIVIEQNADAHPEFVDVTDAGNDAKTMKFKEYSDFELFRHAKPTEKEVKEIMKNSHPRTLCPTCGVLIQNIYLERHINKHLGKTSSSANIL